MGRGVQGPSSTLAPTRACLHNGVTSFIYPHTPVSPHGQQISAPGMHFDVATAPSFSLIPVESHLQGKQRRTPEAGELLGWRWLLRGEMLSSHSHRVDQRHKKLKEGTWNSKTWAVLRMTFL